MKETWKISIKMAIRQWKKTFKRGRKVGVWWRDIGSQARWVYLNMILLQPERYMETRWSKLPLIVRRLLSYEMNRLQGKHNRKRTVPTPYMVKKLGLRKNRRLPVHSIDPTEWDYIYRHQYKHPRSKSIRRQIYPRKGIKNYPVARIQVNRDVSATPKDGKKYNRYTNKRHEVGRWMQRKFDWGLMRHQWQKEERARRKFKL